MNKIHVLDCTLRDGGYCNQWKFGYENTKRIVRGLMDANIDIIECGFLTNKVEYNKDVTKFTKLEEIARVIPNNRCDKMFVAMLNYGEYAVDEIPECDGTSIDGIRVAFHKKDVMAALELCREIKKKGYKVFIQAMVSMAYSDEEFLNLIREVNSMMPYSFYIVDSFGMMKKTDLVRLFYMVENNLKKDIWVGFHSHNNLQLAYSNARELVDVQTNRNLIIDSSIYGMGRGAGNLNTELFVDYLNENMDLNYEIKPLLNIIDEILNGFYQKNYWGYSLPNYLSAVYNAHPNYASYLDDKKTLTVEDMNEIFKMMPEEKRFSYDKMFIEEIYEKYMASGKTSEEQLAEIKEVIRDKKVLLIAPGKSSYEQQQQICEFMGNEDVVAISINADYDFAEPDYIFVSNLRRFRGINADKRNRCIVTSNIHSDDIYFVVDYKKLTNDVEAVKDNAGMMAIKLLIMLDAKEVFLAGFDGYSYNVQDNYGNDQMEILSKNDVIDSMNKGIRNVLDKLGKEIKVNYLTKPKHL